MFPLSLDSPLFLPSLYLLVAGTFAVVAASHAMVPITRRCELRIARAAP